MHTQHAHHRHASSQRQLERRAHLDTDKAEGALGGCNPLGLLLLDCAQLVAARACNDVQNAAVLEWRALPMDDGAAA